MNINKITENILQFEFFTGKELSDNITVLISGKKASIIDTEYPVNMKFVLEYLEKINVEIDNIFISHYHPDHFGGLEICPRRVLYGSRDFKKTMDEHKWEIAEYLIPDKFYEDIGTLRWEDYKLKFINLSGHSVCSFGIIINENTIFVGDTVIGDIHGNTVIPYITTGDIQCAIESIEKIKTGGFTSLLMAHGKQICGTETINRTLDKMLRYLQELLCYEDYYVKKKKEFTEHNKFAFSKWHEFNVKYMRAFTSKE